MDKELFLQYQKEILKNVFDLPTLTEEKFLQLFKLFEVFFIQPPPIMTELYDSNTIFHYNSSVFDIVDLKDHIGSITKQDVESKKKEILSFFKPAPFNFIVFRSVKNLLNVNKICNNGFLSTSLNNLSYFGNILMIIHIKQGDPILFFNPNELEILLPPSCLRRTNTNAINIYTYEITPFRQDDNLTSFFFNKHYKSLLSTKRLRSRRYY